MRRFWCAAAFALAAGSALADMVAKSGGDSVRLTQAPCSVEVLRVIPQGQRGFYQAAAVVSDGVAYEACWAMTQHGTIYLRYADGDSGEIPMEMFEESAP